MFMNFCVGVLRKKPSAKRWFLKNWINQQPALTEKTNFYLYFPHFLKIGAVKATLNPRA
jgi:hypothetical protein